MNIIQPYLEARKMCEQINKSGKDGSRSSKRTDVLNKSVKKYLQQYFKEKDGYTIHLEQQISCSFGTTFKVDVLIKKHGKLFFIAHLKAIQSNYNKNRNNYGGVPISETSRIYDHTKTPENLHSVWIDWVPNQVPNYNKKKEIVSIETTRPANLDNAEKRINNSLKSHDSSICYVKIRFDYKHKSNTAENIKGHEKLEKYLEGIVW